MGNKTTAVYSIINDILKAINHYNDKRRTMTDAIYVFAYTLDNFLGLSSVLCKFPFRHIINTY
jgi:hypothetical protein